MRILYGVQGTGNGHITRARAMAEALQGTGAEVDWLFSGRPADKLFDMAEFGNYRVLKGLTFTVRKGRIDALSTLKKASLRQLWRDIRELDVNAYDLILSDYEPVVAWSARRAGKECIGIGHQYAFAHKIHKAGHNMVSESLMRWFAPVSLGLGVHWHHYDSNILPPIIEPLGALSTGEPRTVLVYLPFEEANAVMSLLHSFTEWQFIVHTDQFPEGQIANVEVKGFSRDGFQASLAKCSRVICNAGFELASESLALGKGLLVKPVQGQMEQVSNALALAELGLGAAMQTLDRDRVDAFLHDSTPVQGKYPNVAQSLANWLTTGREEPIEHLVERLWASVDYQATQTESAPLCTP